MTPAPETSFAAQPKQASRLPEQSAIVVVRPDFERTIDLPGAGPCSRPVDIDRARSGFSQLVSLRVYSFAKDMVIDGEAEDDEVLITLMRGAADLRIDVDMGSSQSFSLSADGGARVAYMPPRASYRLTASTDCDIAYARARPAAAFSIAARAFAPAGGRLDIVDHAAGMALTLATLAAGHSLAESGGRESFAHVRGDGAASVSGTAVEDWETALLHDGDDAAIKGERGMVDILVISATMLRSDASERHRGN